MSIPIDPTADRRHHRVRPDGRVDRPALALAIVDRTRCVPRRNETIVLLLDHERCGVAVVAVAGTDHPDDVVEVVELLSRPGAHHGRADAMVVASVWADRPAGDHARPVLDRWLELHELAGDHGVELLDWFVIDDAVSSRRVDSGVPSPW